MKKFSNIHRSAPFPDLSMFGQSSEGKYLSVRTSIFAHALSYNLDKNNGVGFHFGQLFQEINEDNIEKGVNNFIGVDYRYEFDCINCDSFWIITPMGHIVLSLQQMMVQLILILDGE